MKNNKWLIAGFAMAALLGLGCADEDGETKGASLYVLETDADGSNPVIKVWKETEDLFNSVKEKKGVPGPDRTITLPVWDGYKNLALGGMALDQANGCLYLVAKNGEAVRLDRIRSADDYTKINKKDYHTFSFEANAKTQNQFGQIAVNNGTLYVAEGDGTKSYVWRVKASGDKKKFGGEEDKNKDHTMKVADSDKRCTGLACDNQSVFAFHGDGAPMDENKYKGARIRRGGNAFQTNEAIVYTAAGHLGNSATLALDTRNSLLYVCHWDTKDKRDEPSAYAVGSYKFNQINGFGESGGFKGLVLAREFPNLRIIAHAGSRPWLAGADLTSDKHQKHIHLWRKPESKEEDPQYQYIPLGRRVLGMAFYGR